MSRKPVSLFLARLTPDIWAQFIQFYQKRELDYRPYLPNHGIWIVDGLETIDFGDRRAPVLVAGCCIYPCDGPFAVVEFVSTNPAAPPRLRHRAVSLICQGVAEWSQITGKTALCFPVDKGVERMMQKAGFHRTKEKLTKVMYPPPLGIPVYYEPARANGADPEPATMVDHGG